ncbi:MAG: tetratricopeptide repeat protein [Bacteroidota bacterium]
MQPAKSTIWSILIFSFLFHLGTAQTKELDSLKNLLTTADDTTQVGLLRNLGIYSRSFDKEKAVEYGLKGLYKSREISFKKGEVESLYALGLTHGMTGSYAESLEYLKACLSLSMNLNNHQYIKMSYNSLGIVYKRIGDYTNSKNYYLKSIRLVDSLDLSYNNSPAYTNLGILYEFLKEEDNAVKSYNKSLEVYKGPDKEEHENIILANLAIIDANNGRYNVAVEKYRKIAAYFEKQEDNISLSAVYSTLGNYYTELEHWELSHEYLQKSLAIAEELSLKNSIPEIYHNLAYLMFNQHKYPKAINYSIKNLNFLPAYGDYKNKMDAHELAFDIYETVGQYQKAIYHLNQSVLYKDSLLNEAKVREIQNLQVQHDVYLKDKEISESNLQVALLNAKVSEDRKRLIYLSIIAGLFLFSAALLYYRFLAKKKSNKIFQDKNKLISEQNKTIEKINAELEKRMLRAQMNPHFIFNSLNSIQHLIINSEDKVNALKYLTKFSKLLRQVLESSINSNSTLNEEIELLTIYLELESLRFDNAFNYKIEVDASLDTEEHEIPLLLVQPYVENAIVHGLLPKNGEKELSITFNDKGEYVECIIIDNGVGINTNTDENKLKRPSRGMSITAERINALKKVSDEQLVTIESSIDTKNTGTKVTILIPKQGHFRDNAHLKQVV